LKKTRGLTDCVRRSATAMSASSGAPRKRHAATPVKRFEFPGDNEHFWILSAQPLPMSEMLEGEDVGTSESNLGSDGGSSIGRSRSSDSSRTSSGAEVSRSQQEGRSRQTAGMKPYNNFMFLGESDDDDNDSGGQDSSAGAAAAAAAATADAAAPAMDEEALNRVERNLHALVEKLKKNPDKVSPESTAVIDATLQSLLKGVRGGDGDGRRRQRKWNRAEILSALQGIHTALLGLQQSLWGLASSPPSSSAAVVTAAAVVAEPLLGAGASDEALLPARKLRCDVLRALSPALFTCTDRRNDFCAFAFAVVALFV
jgi:hypothetical protein